jgi:hypothetical protein
MEGADKSEEHEGVTSRSSSTTPAAAGVSRRGAPVEPTALTSSQVEERLRQYER